MFRHIADLYVLYQVVQRLAKPWKDWEAFRLGVINDKGDIIVDKWDRTSEQKSAFTLFDVFVMNLKKIIQRVPYANSRIVTYAAALFLLKEGETLLSEDHVETLTEQFLNESEGGAVPVNNMGDGRIATRPKNMNGKGQDNTLLKRYRKIKNKD